MQKYRNPTIVRGIIIFTIIVFTIASLSPEFMFSMLGISNTEPFALTVYNSCIIAIDALGSNTGQTKEIGIIAMLSLLIMILMFYLIYRILKSIYSHYTTANKAN